MASPNGERRRVATAVTYETLREAGLRYLDRYDATVGKLRRTLTTKARTMSLRLEECERPDTETVAQWVDQILVRFVEVGLINDQRFSEQLATSLRRRGLGKRAIESRLRQRGVSPETASTAIDQVDEGSDNSELIAAMRLVKRRKLGYLRTEELRAERRNRDLAALARAGFNWETARQALEEPIEPLG